MIIFLLAILLFASPAFAQPGPGPFNLTGQHISFTPVNLGTTHTISFQADFHTSGIAIGGDSCGNYAFFADNIGAGGSFYYSAGCGNYVQIPHGGAAGSNLWTVSRSGTTVTLIKNNVAIGQATLPSNLPLVLNTLGAYSDGTFTARVDLDQVNLGGSAPIPPPTSSVTQLLPYQVIPLSAPSVSFTVAASSPVNATVAIQDSAGNALSSAPVALTAGSNPLTYTFDAPVLNYRGGWLRLVVQANGATLASIPFGRGYIFLTAGQSNSGNWECSNCSPANPSPTTNMVAFFDGVNFVTNTTLAPLADGNQQNVWYGLGQRIVSAFGVPVAFIAVGVASTSVADWADTNGLYPRFLYARGIPLDSVLWHNGETDIRAGTSGNDYEFYLKSIINRTRADFGYQVPWFVSHVATTFCDPHGSSTAIGAAQDDTAATVAGVHPGPNTDLISHVCHFDSQAQLDQYISAWFSVLFRQNW